MSMTKHPTRGNPIQEAELGRRDRGVNPLFFPQVVLMSCFSPVQAYRVGVWYLDRKCTVHNLPYTSSCSEKNVE